MFKISLGFATVLLMAASASTPPVSAPVPPPARAELAPTGKLRAGINYGNVILATKDKATGESSGVAIDLTRELTSYAVDVTSTLAFGHDLNTLERGENELQRHIQQVFNVLNWTNYANPTTTFNSGSFGLISNTRNGSGAPGLGFGEPRNVELALKFVW